MSQGWVHHQVGDFRLDVAWRVEPGEVLVLYGPSGAGKTMTLRAVAGLIRPQHGWVEVGGRVVFDSQASAGAGWVPPHRRNVGYVPQHYGLFPHLSVAQNVGYSIPSGSGAQGRVEVEALLRGFRMEDLAGRYPRQLSGGEQQRVALARALATRPQLLLLDEPLAALDVALRREVRRELRHTLEQWGIPTLLVTHDREDVLALGHRMLVLDGGRMVAEGEPTAMLRQPGVATVARLVGVENLFHGRVLSRSPDEGITLCQVGPRSLVLPWLDVAEGEAIQLGLRAADVLLATTEPQGVSAQNVLPGTVQAVRREDGEVYVDVDCGVTFTASVTPRAVATLGLQEGAAVWVVVKATAFFLLHS